jgi:hypothetical protein
MMQIDQAAGAKVGRVGSSNQVVYRAQLLVQKFGRRSSTVRGLSEIKYWMFDSKRVSQEVATASVATSSVRRKAVASRLP